MSFGVGNGSAVDIDSAGGFLAVAYGKCIEIIICIALYRAGFQREDSVCALQVNRCGSCSAAVGIGDYTCCTVRTVGNGNIRAGVELQRILSGTRKPETCKVNLKLFIDSDFAACFNIRSETNGFAAFSGFDRCGQLGCITDGDYFFLVIFRICIVIIAEAIFFIGILSSDYLNAEIDRRSGFTDHMIGLVAHIGRHPNYEGHNLCITGKHMILCGVACVQRSAFADSAHQCVAVKVAFGPVVIQHSKADVVGQFERFTADIGAADFIGNVDAQLVL